MPARLTVYFPSSPARPALFLEGRAGLPAARAPLRRIGP